MCPLASVENSLTSSVNPQINMARMLEPMNLLSSTKCRTAFSVSHVTKKSLGMLTRVCFVEALSSINWIIWGSWEEHKLLEQAWIRPSGQQSSVGIRELPRPRILPRQTSHLLETTRSGSEMRTPQQSQYHLHGDLREILELIRPQERAYLTQRVHQVWQI